MGLEMRSGLLLGGFIFVGTILSPEAAFAQNKAGSIEPPPKTLPQKPPFSVGMIALPEDYFSIRSLRRDLLVLYTEKVNERCKIIGQPKGANKAPLTNTNVVIIRVQDCGSKFRGSFN